MNKLTNLCMCMCIFILAVVFCVRAQETGTLVFHDGDKLKGTLLSFKGGEGLFLSSRFGEISFLSSQATFEADTNSQDSSHLAISNAIDIDEIAGTNTNEFIALEFIRPDQWSLGGGTEYSRGKDDDQFKLNIDFTAKWRRTVNQINLNARSDLKLQDGIKSTDTQRLRANWIHLFSNNIFTETNTYIERDIVTINSEKFDYLLGQAGLGLGYNFIWNEASSTKLSFLHNRLRLSLLNEDAILYTSAESIAIANELQFTENFSLSQWIHIYFWSDGGGRGYDGEADFTYEFDQNLSLILRYTYRDNAFTLDDRFRNTLKMLVRYHF